MPPTCASRTDLPADAMALPSRTKRGRDRILFTSRNPLRRPIFAWPTGLLVLCISGCDRFVGATGRYTAPENALPPAALESASAEPIPCAAHDSECVMEVIFQRVLLLKERFPHLAGLGAVCLESSRIDATFRAALHYEWGVTEIENPKYNPRKKMSRYLPVYDNRTGLSLHLYWYEGRWRGAMAVHPHTIGSLNVVAVVNGPSNTLRQDVLRIISETKQSYEDRHGEEN